MKITTLKKIFITEEIEDSTKWYLSFDKPKFQGGKSLEIDEDTANMLMSIPKLLDFVERYNKQDIEEDIAEISNNLSFLI